LTFVIQDEFKVERVLAFPSPYTPNLAGATLSIGFHSSREGSATIYIYNAAGRVVQTLSLATMQVGFNVTTWSGVDSASDTTLASGVYLIRVYALDNARNYVISRGKFAVY
jgi:flagellar hook assembly protein FlgD